MQALVWLGWSWALAQGGPAPDGPPNEPESWAELAEDLATADASARRAEAAEALQQAPREALAEVARHVLHAIAWRPDATFPFRGTIPLFPALRLNETERQRLLTELMAHRLGLTLRGRPEVPPRLEAELRAMLYEEIEALGEPRSTTDWVHLYGAAGGDVAQLVDRLDLTAGKWAYVVDEDAALRTGALRDSLGLLAHRSSVVRNRAARLFEARPTEATRALMRAWRFTPGRAAPLRGDVAVPQIERDARTAQKWARQLVRWARRSQRQRDDGALRATLHLLTQPGVTRMLAQHERERIATQLVRYARSAPRSQRAIDLGQAMDAVLRRVCFADGTRPAPEELILDRRRWERVSGDETL